MGLDGNVVAAVAGQNRNLKGNRVATEFKGQQAAAALLEALDHAGGLTYSHSDIRIIGAGHGSQLPGNTAAPAADCHRIPQGLQRNGRQPMLQDMQQQLFQQLAAPQVAIDGIYGGRVKGRRRESQGLFSRIAVKNLDHLTNFTNQRHGNIHLAAGDLLDGLNGWTVEGIGNGDVQFVAGLDHRDKIILPGQLGRYETDRIRIDTLAPESDVRQIQLIGEGPVDILLGNYAKADQCFTEAYPAPLLFRQRRSDVVCGDDLGSQENLSQCAFFHVGHGSSCLQVVAELCVVTITAVFKAGMLADKGQLDGA